MSAASFRFPKSQRLHLRKEINALFVSGKSFYNNPFKVFYEFKPMLESPVKIAIAVPKRNTRLAVNRNRIKRLVREAFRLNSHDSRSYFESKGISVHILLIFNSKIAPDFKELQSKIILILQRLQEMHEKSIG